MTDNDEEKKKQMSCRNKIKIVQWWKYKKIFENIKNPNSNSKYNNKGNKSWVNIKIYDVAYAIIKKINLEN